MIPTACGAISGHFCLGCEASARAQPAGKLGATAVLLKNNISSQSRLGKKLSIFLSSAESKLAAWSESEEPRNAFLLMLVFLLRVAVTGLVS
jgi:hypothetical protein